MSVYVADNLGQQRVRIIIVDQNSRCVATGNLITADGPYYRDANGDEYLLVMQYTEAGVLV